MSEDEPGTDGDGARSDAEAGRPEPNGGEQHADGEPADEPVTGGGDDASD